MAVKYTDIIIEPITHLVVVFLNKFLENLDDESVFY